MDLILQTLVNATVASSFAAIFAVGLVLIFGVMNVCNFAQGELYMAGAFTVFYVYSIQELPYVAAVVIAMVVTVGIGIFLELSMFRWKRNDTMGALLLSCGALFGLQSRGDLFLRPRAHEDYLAALPGRHGDILHRWTDDRIPAVDRVLHDGRPAGALLAVPAYDAAGSRAAGLCKRFRGRARFRASTSTRSR